MRIGGGEGRESWGTRGREIAAAVVLPITVFGRFFNISLALIY